MNKAQLLQIEYKQDQGLLFQWNYTGLTREQVYFRHIIVLHTDNHQQALTFLKKYIRKIKPGDLYYIIYYSHLYKVKTLGWKQKPVAEQKKASKPHIQQDITLGNKRMLLSSIETFYSEFSEPIVLSVLLSDLQDREWCQSYITRERFKGKYDFMVGLFAPTHKSTLSFGYKLTVLSTLKDEVEGKIDLFLNTVYQAGIRYARLTVECMNGSITSMVQNNWRTTAFNQIERIYRGPSVQYEKDIIFFFNRTHQDSEEDLVLRLQFMTLDHKKYFSEKRITVRSSREFYQKTFNMEPWIKSYHHSKDIWVSENPYTTFTVIKFQEETSNALF